MTAHHPDGRPPTASASNGDPRGPRVKRPGYSGWWRPGEGPGSALIHGIPHVADGISVPVDPNRNRPRHLRGPELVARGTPQPVGEPCIRNHPFEFRKLNGNGHSYCGECRRLAQVIKRSAARIVAAALAA